MSNKKLFRRIEPIDPQNQEALNTLRSRLSSLSDEQWETLERVEAAWNGIWLETLRIAIYRPCREDLDVLEREGLIRIEGESCHLSEDIKEIIRRYGHRRLRDLNDQASA